ncbi:MAG: tetratricopeptide repeat protein [Saprospiraceae bacterium]
MYYKKIQHNNTLIEFHNNWLGQETVIVNGQEVSKKSSVLGAHHPFTVMEDGHRAAYILTVKMNSLGQVLLDLRRNGIMLQENVIVGMGSKSSNPEEKEKKKGLEALSKYDLDDALEHFEKALAFNALDGEIYFHMACVYSVQERTEDGFEALRKAVENNLQDLDSIFNHDMLAFLRMHPVFEDFVNSDFKTYDLNA